MSNPLGFSFHATLSEKPEWVLAGRLVDWQVLEDLTWAWDSSLAKPVEGFPLEPKWAALQNRLRSRVSRLERGSTYV